MKMKKKIKKGILEVIFIVSLFAVFCISGSLEQGYISTTETIVYVSVAFIALGTSGFMSGLFTKPDYNRRPK